MAFVDPILQERRQNPGDDLISTLATAEEEGRRLTDEEIYNFLRLLFPAGADTTYLGLGSTLYSLLTNPEQLEYVREDLSRAVPVGRGGGDPARPADRVDPAHQPARCGLARPRDPGRRAGLLIGVMAANRDPAVFPDPDRFDVTRHPTSVMTFGFGVHFCLGAHLAACRDRRRVAASSSRGCRTCACERPTA